MFIIDLDNPKKCECETLFKVDYKSEFHVSKGCLSVEVEFNEGGSIDVLEEDFELTGDQIYDHLAYAAGVISESEAYWYEPEVNADDDYECRNDQGNLSNRELDGRFEGNW
jgi:hypothetical protein